MLCDGVIACDGAENTLYFGSTTHRAMFKEAQSFPPLTLREKGSTMPSFARDGAVFDEPEELIAGNVPPGRGAPRRA